MDLDELGAFLRSRRDRIRPSDVGLPVGPRRRVPGLRRDEVAVLAGASVEYYTELERGRGARPSEQMLSALARALRLTGDEREHLFLLADRPVPPRGSTGEHVHPGLLDLVRRVDDSTPAAVITDLHVPLVQNRMADALLGPMPSRAGISGVGVEHGMVYRWFTDPSSRSLYPVEDHPHHSALFTADLRAALVRRGGDDADARSLIDALQARSPEFAALWDRRDVAVRRHDRKRIVHPRLGVIEVNCLNLFSEDGRQRLLWFTPAIGTDGAAKLDLLGVLGTEDMTVSRVPTPAG